MTDLRERNSSFGLLWDRLAALMRARDAQEEDEVREELRQLAEEALLLSRSYPLWPSRPSEHVGRRGYGERATVGWTCPTCLAHVAPHHVHRCAHP